VNLQKKMGREVRGDLQFSGNVAVKNITMKFL
jgi:hypothetical protein